MFGFSILAKDEKKKKKRKKDLVSSSRATSWLHKIFGVKPFSAQHSPQILTISSLTNNEECGLIYPYSYFHFIFKYSLVANSLVEVTR